MTAADLGWVACKPASTRGVKLHLLSRPGADAPTLCGRYTFADALDEATPASYPRCQVCETTAARHQAARARVAAMQRGVDRLRDELGAEGVQ